VFALRIRFKNQKLAYECFHSFPPDDIPAIQGWTRKRTGDSQTILLHLENDSDIEEFYALCAKHPHIAAVESITEEEFRTALSNSV
jgi:hypothetical protein